MCLYVKKAKRPRRIMKVWKVVRVEVVDTGIKLSGGELTRVALTGIYFPAEYKIGENKATGKTSPARRKSGRVDGGAFHTYLRRERAPLGDQVTVPFYGRPEHYVAHGTNRQICYTHLTLKPEDYDKAVKQAARKWKEYELKQAKAGNSCS